MLLTRGDPFPDSTGTDFSQLLVFGQTNNEICLAKKTLNSCPGNFSLTLVGGSPLLLLISDSQEEGWTQSEEQR